MIGRTQVPFPPSPPSNQHWEVAVEIKPHVYVYEEGVHDKNNIRLVSRAFSPVFCDSGTIALQYWLTGCIRNVIGVRAKSVPRLN